MKKIAQKGTKEMRAALKRAVASARGVGKQRGLSVIAREIGLTRQTIGKWKICPAEYVVGVEKVSGVPRHELRPDIFGALPPTPIQRPAT